MVVRGAFDRFAVRKQDQLFHAIKRRRLRDEALHEKRKQIESHINDNDGGTDINAPISTRDLRKAYEFAEAEVTEEIVEAARLTPEDRDAFERRISSAFLKYVLSGPRLYLIGPLGQVVPVAHTVLRTEHYYQLNRVENRHVSLFRAVTSIWGERQFCFLADDTLTVSVTEVAASAEAARHLSGVAFFQTRPPILNALRSFGERGQIARPLLPYEGWPCCLRADDWPKREALASLFGVELDSQEAPVVAAEPTRRGRRRKIDHAAEWYRSRFPNGHGSFTWKEVCEAARLETGLTVGTDTMRDAARLTS
jgi:hypothetical protein